MSKDMIKVKVHGLKELDKALNKLDLDLRKRASREAGRKAMEPVAKEIKSNTPVDSGRLKETVKVSATNAVSRLNKYSKKASMIASANVGTKSKDITKTATHAIHLEYGTKNIYAGVPVIIGSEGVEKIIELDLSADERKNFDNSIQAVKELFDAAKKIDPELQ